MLGSGSNDRATRKGVDPESWVEVGRVLRPSGLDGSLLVRLHGEEPDNLLKAPRVQLSGGPGSIPFAVREAEPASPSRDGRARARLSLEGVETRERCESWTGASVAIPEAALPALPDGEFYWRDILGLQARLPDGRVLGAVEEIWPTAGHDLLVIGNGVDRFLIPAAPPLLGRVDPAAGCVWIDPPPELLEPSESVAREEG